jgi:uncharacterized protein YutE (UPF0331/DUF86 family)
MEAFGDDFSLDAFTAASGSSDPEELARVYAVERPLELLENYVVELAAAGIELAGLRGPGEPASGIRDLRHLQAEGVVSRRRCDRLVRLHEIRNMLVHEYPDLRARTVHEAAGLLVVELPGFLRDYGAWLRSLGYGRSG